MTGEPQRRAEIEEAEYYSNDPHREESMTVEQVQEPATPAAAPAAPGEGETFAEQLLEGHTLATFHRAMLEVVRGCWRILPDRFDACAANVQQDAIDRASLAIDKASRRALDMLASGMRPTVSVDIDSVSFGEKIKIQCTAGKGAEHRHEIADAAKGSALLVLLTYPERTSVRAGDSTDIRKPIDTTGDLFGGTPAADGETVTGDGTGEALPPFEDGETPALAIFPDDDKPSATSNGVAGEPSFE